MSDVTLIRAHVNPSSEFDEKHRAASEGMNTERAPRKGDWGVCVGGDASAAIGGQVMVFTWYESREALIHAISEHLVYLFLPPQGYDLIAAQTRVKAAIGAFAAHNDPIQLAQDLRDNLRSHVRIDWIGGLNDLLVGKDEFAREIRAEFLDQEEAQEVQPIPASAEEEFCEFLSYWLSGS